VISVFGLLGAPDATLRAAVADADWVVAGSRHLDALAVKQSRRITLGSMIEAVARLKAMPASEQAVVVASGDPLFFGVVRTLRTHGLQPHVRTAPSSVQAAFAAVGLPWEDAETVSVHGRPLAPALNLARAFAKVGVLTSAEHGIRELAAGLTDIERWFVLAERLGSPDSRVQVLTGTQALRAQPVEPNVVLVLEAPPTELDPAWQGQLARADRGPVGRVTPAAAVAFARLLPRPGDLLWGDGPLAEEVAALAHWAGAAVTAPHACTNRPDLVLSADPTLLADSELFTDSAGAQQPRVVVLSCPDHSQLSPNYDWHHEQIDSQCLTTGILR
jgi:precorrin-6y C5,15-methyltransferase (decarboxylating) CbiE subunit